MGLPKADPFTRLLRADAQAVAHAVSLCQGETTSMSLGCVINSSTRYRKFFRGLRSGMSSAKVVPSFFTGAG
jgi:hypothetical protein